MTQPVLRVISGDASPEEVAAIVAAVSVLETERQRAAASLPASAATATGTSAWVDASRRTARAVPSTRGSWRMSGRVPRRLR